MPKTMIADLQPGETVCDAFVLTSFKLSPFRNKPGQYLDLRLADKTGEIPARMWEGGEEAAECLTPGTIVMVEARVDEYRGEKQLVLGGVRPAEAGQFEHADFVRVASRPISEMAAELGVVIGTVEDEHLRGLLDDIFGDEEFLRRFVYAPGARHYHHACVGGLLQHTLSVVAVCRQAAEIHPELNRDLLLTAALLHDLGKVFELEGDLNIEYTDAGYFFGHVVLTDRYVTERLREREGFPPQLAALLTHMLLSHHGQRDWGAPVTPVIAEAFALHHADNLDAKVQMATDYLMHPDMESGDWTRWHRGLETRLYVRPSPAEEEGAGQ